MIALFYCFPVIENTSQNIQQHEFAITISDIPSTLQESESSGQSAPPSPSLPNIILPDDGGDFEMVLKDINIPTGNGETINGSGQGSAEGSSAGSSGKGDSQISSGSFIPRQILEVFPEKTKSKHSGQIKLSLRIGADGKVISHKVLQNTTGSGECLENSIKAAYKSKWNPVNTGPENRTFEYWVEKVYEFR